MDSETTYNPTRQLTRWQRFQVWAYDRYGVDAGNMVAAMAMAFVTTVTLGVVLVIQL